MASGGVGGHASQVKVLLHSEMIAVTICGLRAWLREFKLYIIQIMFSLFSFFYLLVRNINNTSAKPKQKSLFELLLERY